MMNFKLYDDFGPTVFGVLFAIIGFVLLLFFGIGFLTYTVNVDTCHDFSTQANRTTEFVRYNYVSWDCLVETQSGEWISISALRGE